MNLQTLAIRTQVIDATRQFFRKQNFREVDTPVLLPSLPLEQNLYSFKTTWEQRHEDYYMSISPESTLKKLLAAGFGNCFALSKCFRNLENTGDTHYFEFTMLEYYELAKDYKDIASKTHKLINYICERIGKKEVKRVNFRLADLFRDFAAINLDEYLADPNFSEPDFNQTFLNKIEPQLPIDKLVIIFDYPTRLSPLALPIKDTPYSQRFEVYLRGVEIGNGNTESTMAPDILSAFYLEQKYRLDHQLPTHPIDTDFVNACRQLPACAGIGLGIDRIAMIMAGTTTISDVLWL